VEERTFLDDEATGSHEAIDVEINASSCLDYSAKRMRGEVSSRPGGVWDLAAIR
jgi:hypothetical protein